MPSEKQKPLPRWVVPTIATVGGLAALSPAVYLGGRELYRLRKSYLKHGTFVEKVKKNYQQEQLNNFVPSPNQTPIAILPPPTPDHNIYLIDKYVQHSYQCGLYAAGQATIMANGYTPLEQKGFMVIEFPNTYEKIHTTCPIGKGMEPLLEKLADEFGGLPAINLFGGKKKLTPLELEHVSAFYNGELPSIAFTVNVSSMRFLTVYEPLEHWFALGMYRTEKEGEVVYLVFDTTLQIEHHQMLKLIENVIGNLNTQVSNYMIEQWT